METLDKGVRGAGPETAAASPVSLVLLRLIATFLFITSLALSARFRIPLPWSPVPVTAQTLVVLLFPALLGPAWGACGVIAYLLGGIGGLPCFALGGGGMIYLLGPTGGYLWGFLLSAIAVGFLVRRRPDSPFAVIGAMALGELIILLCGALQLQAVTGRGWGWVWWAGLWPFLAGDLIKLLMAAGLYFGSRRIGMRFDLSSIA